MENGPVEPDFAIEFLHVYPLRFSELTYLDDDSIGALGLSSYAINEINFLARLFIMSWHKDTNHREVDLILSAQRLFIMRVWSAKLFEFVEFCSQKGSSNKTQSKTLLAALSTARAKIKEIRDSKAYSLARDLRHETANHYSLKAAKKNVKHIDPNADVSLYLHKLQGNGHYALGDELVFSGRLNRFMKDQGISTSHDLINNWMDWNLIATRLAHEIHKTLYSELVISKHPKKYRRKKMLWLPWSAIGYRDYPLLPAFFRKDRK